MTTPTEPRSVSERAETVSSRFQCDNCEDEWWVCENHPDKAWAANLQYDHDEEHVCDCGAGAPCKVCNEPLVHWDFEKPGCEIICSVWDEARPPHSKDSGV